MSRFDQKYHKKLLEDPRPGRWRNTPLLRKEKQLWEHKKFIDIITSPFFANLIVFPCCALGLLFIILFLFLDQDLYIWLSFIVVLGPLLSIFTLSVSCGIWFQVRAKNIVRNRNDIELEELILNSPSIQKYNRYHIKAIRQTLGHVYSVNYKIIYLSDTPESLRSLGCTIEPYGFEVILGVSRKLGITLIESEVDRIANKIHNNAHNVEELTAILCEEMLVAEELQAEKSPEEYFVSIEPETKAENNLNSRGKISWKLPAFFAFLAAIGAIQGILENGDELFTVPSIVYILVAMAVSYAVAFIIFTIILKFLLSDERKLKQDLKEVSITLEDLEMLADSSPPMRYVNCLLMELYRKQDYEKILKKYEPLPLIDDFDPDEIPWFAEVSNRLKKTAKIEQIPFIKPRNETIALVIDKQSVDRRVEFCDGLKNGYVTLSLEPHDNWYKE